MIMNEVMSNINVLGTRVLDWILGNVDGTCVSILYWQHSG